MDEKSKRLESVALYPLHIIEIDHVRLDIEVVEPQTEIVLGRPWLTLGIDVFSRMIWCMHLSFYPPSGMTLLRAIEHGVFPKDSKSRFGTYHDWEVFGIPETISVDGGREFRSTQVEQVADTLNSTIQFRPKTTVRFGAVVDRLFGQIENVVGTMLGGGAESLRESSTLSLAALRQTLVRYIVDVYSHQPHPALPEGSTPYQRFHQGLQLSGIPRVIPPEQEQQVKFALLPSALRSYHRAGIRLNNVLYWLDRLSYLREDRHAKYVIKYNPDDLSKIYLQMPDTGEFVKVPAVPRKTVAFEMDKHSLMITDWWLND